MACLALRERPHLTTETNAVAVLARVDGYIIRDVVATWHDDATRLTIPEDAIHANEYVLRAFAAIPDDPRTAQEIHDVLWSQANVFIGFMDGFDDENTLIGQAINRGDREDAYAYIRAVCDEIGFDIDPNEVTGAWVDMAVWRDAAGSFNPDGSPNLG